MEVEAEAAEAPRKKPTWTSGIKPEATFNKGEHLHLRSKPARCILVKNIN